jgi:hypothetical protein
MREFLCMYKHTHAYAHRTRMLIYRMTVAVRSCSLVFSDEMLFVPERPTTIIFALITDRQHLPGCENSRLTETLSTRPGIALFPP